MASPQDHEQPEVEVLFLTLDEIETIHANQLALYGGQAGYLNKHLIESAVDAPKQTAFRQNLYDGIPDMASVYLFQICESQGFVDGNKRTAVAACLTFLMANGYELQGPDIEAQLYELTMRVARKQITREQVADWLRERIALIK